MSRQEKKVKETADYSFTRNVVILYIEEIYIGMCKFS